MGKNVLKKIRIGLLGGLILVGIYACFGMQSGVKQFHYGDWYYWLATDQTVREFPIVVAQQEDIIFEEEMQDGAQPKILHLIYISQTNN